MNFLQEISLEIFLFRNPRASLARAAFLLKLSLIPAIDLLPPCLWLEDLVNCLGMSCVFGMWCRPPPLWWCGWWCWNLNVDTLKFHVFYNAFVMWICFSVQACAMRFRVDLLMHEVCSRCNWSASWSLANWPPNAYCKSPDVCMVGGGYTMGGADGRWSLIIYIYIYMYIYIYIWGVPPHKVR